MRIVIDFQGVQASFNRSDIFYYSLTFINEFIQNTSEHDVWVVVNGCYPDSIPVIRTTISHNISIEKIRTYLTPSGSNSASDGLIRTQFITQLKPDYLFITGLSAKDLNISFDKYLHSTRVSVFSFDFLMVNELVSNVNSNIKYLFSRLSNIYTPLQYIRNTIVDLGLMSEDYVQAIPFFVDNNAIINDDAMANQILNEYGDYVLINIYSSFPNAFDNLKKLIELYKSLPNHIINNHKLVIVNVNNHAAINMKSYRWIKNNSDLYISDLEGYLIEGINSNANLCIALCDDSNIEYVTLNSLKYNAPLLIAGEHFITETVDFEEVMLELSRESQSYKKIIKAISDEGYRSNIKQITKKSIENSIIDSEDEFSEVVELIMSECSRSDLSEFQVGDDQLGDLDSLINDISSLDEFCSTTDKQLCAISNSIAFNLNTGNKNKLLIDISEIVREDAKTGVQRVVRSIINTLYKNIPERYDICPIYFDGQDYRYASEYTYTYFENTINYPDSQVVEFFQDDIYFALDLNARITHSVYPIHLYLHQIGVKMYFIVYDILLIHHPEWWLAGKSEIFQEWLKSISEVATGLVCISESVANDVREWISKNTLLRCDRPDIFSFHLGADVENSLPSKGMPDNANRILSAMLSKPSFLMVGTIEPRKGYEQALDAFEILWNKGLDINLIIVGKEGWLVHRLIKRLRNHMESNIRLFWLEGISDEYLASVYDACSCIISASEGEGFGLPLIEAAQHKKPIIARNLPVFHEVAGEGAFYFSGNSPSSLAVAVEKWLDLDEKGKAPKSSNIKWLTWQQSVEKLHTIIFDSNH